MKDIDLLAIGEPMAEFAAVRDMPGHYVRGFGGDTGNAVIAAARQGARCAYLTRLGNDLAGASIEGLFRDEGVDTSSISRDPTRPTGMYFIHYEDGRHVFSYARSGSAASALEPHDLERAPVARARFLHFSAISLAISNSACDLCFAAAEQARNTNTRVTFDANLRLALWPLPRARAIIAEAISLSDYFLPSLEDLVALSGRHDVPGCLEWSFARGARTIVLKCGPDGAWIASRSGDPVHVPGFPVDAVDATGAGDCFAGSLIARLAAGDPDRVAVRYANAAAALCVTGIGAIAPIPRAASVSALISGREAS